MIKKYSLKMVKTLFFSLFLLGSVVYGQDVKVTALPVATSPDQDDVLYFIQDGISTQIAKSTLFRETSDSVADNTAAIAAINVTQDSSWTSITVDTISEKTTDAGVVFTDNIIIPDGDSIIFTNNDWAIHSNSGPGSRLRFTNDDTNYFTVNVDEAQITGDLYISGEISVDRIIHVIEDQVLYSNTSQTNIISLPADAVIWDIQVEVRTQFNGSTDNELDIGVTGTGNRYENNLDISTTGFKTMTLTNVPDRMTGTTAITFEYFDNSADATTGEAYIYVHYSKH